VRRTEQWERAIAEAKHELDEVESVILRQSQPEGDVDMQAATSVDESVNAKSDSWSFDGDVPEVEAELQDHLTSTISHPRSSIAHREDAVRQYHVPPQSIYASAYEKALHARTILHPKKLETIELAVDLLQLKAFANLKERGWQNRAAAAVPSEYAQYFMMENDELRDMYERKVSDIKRLRQVPSDEMADFTRSQADQPLCNYTQDHGGVHLDTTSELNDSLQELFRLRLEGVLHAAELTAKVYYNLHISSAPPNIDTFNALILGFSRARQPDQVRDIISAIHVAHIRHNEVTLATILRFFTATGDSGNFWQWFGRIRGWYDGLMTTRPDVVINQAASDRLIDHRNGAPSGRVLQLPTPTPMVFGAIVRGVLKFNGFGAAMELCEKMGEEGWRLSMSGLAPLLKDCSTRGDLAAGLAIWDQIQTRRAARARRTFTRNPVVIHIDTYTSMLRLCSRCNQQELFAQILDEAKNEHGISYADLTVLVKNALSEPPAFRYAGSVKINQFTKSGIYDDDLGGPPNVAINTATEAEPPPSPTQSSGHAPTRPRSHEEISNPISRKQQRRPSVQYNIQPITSAEYATLVNTPLPQPPQPSTRTTLFHGDTLPNEDAPSAFDALADDTTETTSHTKHAASQPSKADSPMQSESTLDAESFVHLNLLDEPLSPSKEITDEPPPPHPRLPIRPTYGEDLFIRPRSFAWCDDM
jgi:hypothetical protein